MILGSQVQVVGQAGSLAEARELLDSTEADVVLLDLELPDGSGIELLKELPEKTAAVVLTAFLREHEVVSALESGARGYLLKGAPSADILAALQSAAEGESFLSPRVSSVLASSMQGARRPSPRELEVLELLVQGQSNREIGETLFISERTVKFHVSSLMNKLGAENRARMAALAVQKGWVRS